MSRKKLDEQTIVNELKGSSLFFQPSSPHSEESKKHVARTPVIKQEGTEMAKNTSYTASESSPSQTSSEEPSDNRKGMLKRDGEVTNQRRHYTKTPRYRDTTQSGYPDKIIETIRKAVKQLGKEAATHRFTLEEKKLLRDIVYTYETRGIRTSENRNSSLGGGLSREQRYQRVSKGSG